VKKYLVYVTVKATYSYDISANSYSDAVEIARRSAKKLKHTPSGMEWCSGGLYFDGVVENRGCDTDEDERP
jgi:hypothetical protein